MNGMAIVAVVVRGAGVNAVVFDTAVNRMVSITISVSVSASAMA